MRKRIYAAALAGPGALAWSGTALACSVCLSASEETRQAYYGSTVLMAVLPLVMLGGFAFWLRRLAARDR